MFFRFIDRSGSLPSQGTSCAFLLYDRWDDWGKYRTQFNLFVFDEEGTRHQPGEVKIGHAGLEPGGEVGPNTRAPALEPSFSELPEHYFSLGQSENYYETLNTLSPELKEKVLVGLRDLALDHNRFELIASEPVMVDSLLRSVNSYTIRTKFTRLASGDAALTRFNFSYELPAFAGSDESPPTLEFHVIPETIPPTNVHVLIGRNGAGKSTCMQGLGRALVNKDHAGHPVGNLRSPDIADELPFAGLVLVAFSAFDDFKIPANASGLKAEMIGLLAQGADDQQDQTKSAEQLRADFARSLGNCRFGPRQKRWLRALETLENDPLFKEANVSALLDLDEDTFAEQAERLFKRLSSGHKIVLLTITRLVELVDESTLVLLDEPEGHLHPPLLSAFVRALADLLIQRNGVAIIATHSPVVLQEVPASCVWVLRRNGTVVVAERPELETFGENVGVLTHSVFGLEVTNTGFHKMVSDAVQKEGLDFDGVMGKFEGQLGAEAMAIARSLTVSSQRSG
jgi:predicted ATPase